MKKAIAVLVVMMFVSANVFAGGVTDNNNGNAGYLFISTGENNGANSVGTWVNASDVPELKGEKGDKGDKGDTGATGEQGIQGETGNTGEAGQNGNDGQNGQDGKTGDKGEKGNQGQKGETGKGLKDAYELQFEGVLKETRKTATSVYYIRDFNNDNNTIGLKFKYYFGQSYADQVREDLQRQIDELKGLQENVSLVDRDNMEVVPTATGMKLQKKVEF